MATTAGRDILRRIRFEPYTKGAGPTFALTVWDTWRRDYRDAPVLGYRLTMTTPRPSHSARCTDVNDRSARSRCICRARTVTLFEGQDFGASPLQCIDSDATVAALMGFLTLRPGDTDAEYFASYTPAQLAYCDAHAEALALEVERRFGERD